MVAAMNECELNFDEHFYFVNLYLEKILHTPLFKARILFRIKVFTRVPAKIENMNVTGFKRQVYGSSGKIDLESNGWL